MKIALGSDHAGFPLKKDIREYLELKGLEVIDVGTFSLDSVDYPDFATAVATKILDGNASLGILVCGTGLGMAITANRYIGIRAVTVSECYSAEMGRAHNNANVLCLGARVVGLGLACRIIDSFLNVAYEGGRHERRVAKIDMVQ